MSIADVIKGRSAAVVKIEVLDLDVDGSPAVNVAVSASTFDYITRVILNLRFADAAVEWSVFAAEATALTNGWFMYYDGAPLFSASPIKDNGDFFNIGYDVDLVADAAGTPNQVLTARWSFDKMSPHGLAMWDGETFGATIQDDLSVLASIDSFEAFVEGWKAHV